jgi:hypothetical protein
MTEQALAKSAAAAEAQLCAAYRHDYVKLAAWMFAVLFGPALVAIALWLS